MEVAKASMGPRHFCRGNPDVAAQHDIFAIASMGPRHFCRGNAVLVSVAGLAQAGFNGATAFLPWKCRRGNLSEPLHDQLQWGHGISAVEMPHHQPHPLTLQLASMGPRHFCRGNRQNQDTNPM